MFRATVPWSILGGVTGDFFSVAPPRRNHVLWGRLSLWKWVPGISPVVKAAGAYGWRPTTIVVPNFKKIRGLNLPGTPWATSASFGMTFTFTCFEQPSGHHQENLIVSVHHLVYITLCRWLPGMPGSHLHRVIYTRLFIDTIDSPDYEHWVARNM